MQVKVINLSKNPLPKYETDKAAGLDVRADLSRFTPQNLPKLFGDCELIYEGNGHPKAMVRLGVGSRILVPTGLKVAIPEGYEIKVRPRSGLALKKGITVLNTPGCVDSDFRGEIGVILINHGTEPFWFEDGERIAQFTLEKVEHIDWEEVTELDTTSRNSEGFGTTGTK